MDTLRRLHTLKLSHNQLIGCQGLGATPTIQMIDMSHNHLQHVDDIEKLCLLLSLNVSSNNLLNVRLYIAYHSILLYGLQILSTFTGLKNLLCSLRIVNQFSINLLDCLSFYQLNVK